MTRLFKGKEVCASMASNKNDARRQHLLFVGVVCVMLMVVVGSVLFFVALYGGRGSPSQVRRTTATATATAASPTAVLQPTPQVLCYDYFLDNQKGWATGDAAGYVRAVAGGQLTLSVTNHKPLIESMPTGCMTRDFSDFSLTLTLTMLQADRHDSVGLYVRGDSNLDHDYRIDIFGDGSYCVSKEWLDESNNQIRTMLVVPTYTEALQPVGKENTITVMMKGSTMVLLINGKVVKEVTDTDYTHGQAALFIDHGGTSQVVTATFSSIAIATAPDTLQGG